jgi:hypothetical protein
MTRTPASEVTTTVSDSGHPTPVASPITRPFSTDALRAAVSSSSRPQVILILDENQQQCWRQSSETRRVLFPTVVTETRRYQQSYWVGAGEWVPAPCGPPGRRCEVAERRSSYRIGRKKIHPRRTAAIADRHVDSAHSAG